MIRFNVERNIVTMDVSSHAVSMAVSSQKSVQMTTEKAVTVGGTYFKTDETLTLEDGVLGVNMAEEVGDFTLPITAAAVNTTVGNIEVLLEMI